MTVVFHLSGDSPAAFTIGTHSSLVELADGGGFTVGGVMREQAAAALPAHTVEEVPETAQPSPLLLTPNKHSCHHGNYNYNKKRQQYWHARKLTTAAPEPRHQ